HLQGRVHRAGTGRVKARESALQLLDHFITMLGPLHKQLKQQVLHVAPSENSFRRHAKTSAKSSHASPSFRRPAIAALSLETVVRSLLVHRSYLLHQSPIRR